MEKEPKNEIIGVSDYIIRLNATLKTEKAKIVGEVSGLNKGPTGHVYFTMKDENGSASISCVIWNSKYNLYNLELKDGLKIYATGTPNVYAPSGRLSFVADVIELAGEGALQMAYEKLKKKLEIEGLFAEAKKKSIPDFPTKIGVITSKGGAVINDFLTNIGKFGYEILFVDSRVEGQEATDDLLSAVETLRGKNIDVLVIMRGGGSLESFQAFNNETLVRAVANFPVPVLTGIGHDKDMPLVAMVSDKNVSTPTAVANLLNKSWNEALSLVILSEEKIFSRFQSLLVVFKDAEKTMFQSLVRIESEIGRIGDRIKTQTKELITGFENVQKRTKEFILQSAKTIEMGDPKRQLSRGYSIVKSKGKIIRKAKSVGSGDDLELMVSDGIIEAKVT